MDYEREQERLATAINQDKIVLDSLKKQIKDKEEELSLFTQRVDMSIAELKIKEKAIEKDSAQFDKDLFAVKKEFSDTLMALNDLKVKIAQNIALKEASDGNLKLALDKQAEEVNKQKKLEFSTAELTDKKDALIVEITDLKSEKLELEKANKIISGDTEGKALASAELDKVLETNKEELDTVSAEVKEERNKLGALGETKKALEKEIEGLVVSRDTALAEFESAKAELKNRNTSIANREVLLKQKEQEIRIKCKELNIPYVEGMTPVEESEEIGKLKAKLAGYEAKNSEVKKKEQEVRFNCKRLGIPYAEGEKLTKKEEAIGAVHNKELFLQEKEASLRAKCEFLRIPFDEELPEPKNEKERLQDMKISLANKERMLEAREEQIRGKYKELNIPYV